MTKASRDRFWIGLQERSYDGFQLSLWAKTTRLSSEVRMSFFSLTFLSIDMKQRAAYKGVYNPIVCSFDRDDLGSNFIICMHCEQALFFVC